MPKFANVATIEVAPGRRDQVVTSLLAHKARLIGEPGTLQFEVLCRNSDETTWSAVRGRGLVAVTKSRATLSFHALQLTKLIERANRNQFKAHEVGLSQR